MLKDELDLIVIFKRAHSDVEAQHIKIICI